MNHSDYRRFARESLRGKWPPAVLACLIASLLGAGTYGGPKLELNINEEGLNAGIEYAGQTFTFGQGLENALPAVVTGAALIALTVALIAALALFVVGSAVSVGYARYNLNLADGNKASLSDLFAYFSRIDTMAIARLLRGVYMFLWSLLLVFPGIIASYRYRMTDYLLAEDPTLAPDKAITLSKELMNGRKFDLFILDLSFIGWEILCIFTFGIGHLWLTPYKQASYAAFYRSLTMSGYQNMMSSD